MIPKPDSRLPLKDVSSVFPDRWSPRAMTGEPVSREELMSLFEAARWAPSCFNNQPSRMVYALRDTPQWDTLFNLLAPANQTWCVRAAALVIFIAKTTFDYNGKPNRTYAFDAGAAWMSFALEGHLKGLVVHGMAGFDYARAREAVALPDGFEVMAMAAVGRYGSVDLLPEDVRKRDLPSGRKTLDEIAFPLELSGSGAFAGTGH